MDYSGGRLHVDVRRNEFESNADAARRPHTLSSGLDQRSYDSYNDAPGERYFFTSPRHHQRLDERIDLGSDSADRNYPQHRQAPSTRPHGVGSSFAFDGMKRTNEVVSNLDDSDVHRKQRRRESAAATVRVERDLFEQEVQAQNAEIDSLKRQLFAAQEGNDLLKKECEGALEDALQEVDHLKRELAYTKTEAEQLKEDVKDLTSENVVLRGELEEHRNDTDFMDLKRELDRAEDKAHSVYEEKVRLEKNFQLILREKVECEESILRGKVECEGKIEDAKREADELARERNILEKEVSFLKEELAAVGARCEDDLSHRDDEIRRRDDEIHDLKNEVVQLAKDRSASRERQVLFDEMAAALEVAAREKDENMERCNSLLEEARELKDKSMASSYKIDFLTKERDNLSRAVADMEGFVKKERDEHAQTVADLERTVAKLKAEKDNVSIQRNDLKEELIMVLESVSDASAGADHEYGY